MKTPYTFLISLLCTLSAYTAFAQTPSVVVKEPGTNSRDVTLTAAGTLAEALGEDVNLVDSLVVRGPINKADFTTLWKSTFHGNLKVVDLENATIEDGIVPEGAFFNKDVQYHGDKETISSIKLEKLILPANRTEIGEYACSYAANLCVVQLPASLRIIGVSAFEDCTNLTVDSFTFPESLEVLKSQCFLGCSRLIGEVIFPEGLKRIESAAFMNCYIWSENLPQSLEFLGCAAFSGCGFTEVNLPDNCELELDGRQFADNSKLVRAHLPETCEIVPEGIFLNCVKLKDVNIPSDAKCVLMNAFNNCASLQSVYFPEGMEILFFSAFKSCSSLSEVMLPSTLKTVGNSCFEGAVEVKNLYCKALVPPACSKVSYPNACPFGSYEGTDRHGMSRDTPLYVPVGTADLYRSTWGWNYFNNIIETDDFPSLSVSDIDVDGGEDADAPVYDLMGRRVDSPQPGQIYIRAGKKFTVKP